MLTDLAGERVARPLTGDVCIIGTGPAGLALARSLAEQGRSVVLVEKGGCHAERRSDTGFAFARREYKGAALGRAFGFGGTSTLWGGGLLPMRPEELSARGEAAAWPIAHDEVARHAPQLQRWLGVDELPFGLDFARSARHPLAALDWSGLDARFLKWIPFRGRNLGAAWWPQLLRTRRVRGLLNAEAADCDRSAARGLTRLCVRAPGGAEAEVRCEQYVVCAGALETPRLLHRLDVLHAPSRAHLGRYLHDHLSLRVAEVEVIDRTSFLRHFAPSFNGGTMHSLRIELDAEGRAAEALAPAYAHFVAEAPEDSGFAVLRDLLRGAQQRGLAGAGPALGRIPAALPEIMDMLGWRYGARRLAFPRRATLSLLVDFEQPVLACNRVAPGAAPADAWTLDWDLGCRPGRLAEAMARRLSAWWSANRLEHMARLRFLDAAEIEARWPDNLYDIYHPAGTARMAARPEDGVVNPDLGVFGCGNLHALSTAVFPSLGAANPTFTLMCLALRLGERLGREG
jgi:glycine/D-amino acid oxidase-like deaminating enzyme